MKKKIPVSFVIPVYKSEKTIAHVIDEIASVGSFDWEAILINDNSPDHVDAVIRKIIRRYPKKVRYYTLHKNSGQHQALMNGLKFVTKPYIATIDDDGQNDPRDIIKCMKKLRDDDLDVVYGEIREKHENTARRYASKLNQYLCRFTINNARGIPTSNVRLMRDHIVKSMADISGQYDYIDGLIFSLTDHIGSVLIKQRKRYAGSSSYTFFKLISLWANQIIGYSNIILKMISLLSLGISLTAFLIGATYFFISVNNANRLTGWLSTYLTLTILLSFVFLILSILTEYISRMYTRINQPKIKIIRKIHP